MTGVGGAGDTAAALLTRRQYLTLRASLFGAPWWMVREAVASTAIEHPEWDMDEERTWNGWWGDVDA